MSDQQQSLSNMLSPSPFSSLSSTPSSTPSSSPISTSSSSPFSPNGVKTKKMTICVEGNIGSGKTSLLEYLSSLTDDVQVIREPVNAWRNVRGHNLLDLMYDDPKRWSFAFQSYAQLSMVQIHKAPYTCSVKLMERSVFSSKYCFIEGLHQSGRMSDAEYAILTEWFDWNSRNVKVDQIVYLRSSPEYCRHRIMHRNREEETGISLEYLTKIHDLHEDWLIHKKFPLPAPVMVIDVNKPLKEVQEYYRENMETILSTSSSEEDMQTSLDLSL